MTSNVGQNFPYSSETESERIAAVELAVERFSALRESIAKEATPVGETPPDHRWFVYVCPVGGFDGRLHVAGYALERHAVYTVCDSCGKTFLR